MPAADERIRVLGLPLDNLARDRALERIEALVASGGSALVFFLNAHCVNLAVRDPAYRRALERADLVLADGSGLALAGRLLGRPIRENLNGTDLFPPLAARLAGRGRRVFLLGGRPGAAEGVAAWLAGNHPGLVVVGHAHGYFDRQDQADLVRRIRAGRADVLLAALGTPRQELWLAANLAACGVPVGMGVGGLFDFYSGRLPRAPRALRRLGMEWAWRLLQEPRRLWRRYLPGNFLFLHRVWRQSRGRWP